MPFVFSPLQKMRDQVDTFVPTRASALQKKSNIDFQEITYESYKPTKNKKNSRLEGLTNNGGHSDFNIKKAKYEIMKFGMSGFDPQKKEEAQVQLAIKLGKFLLVVFNITTNFPFY